LSGVDSPWLVQQLNAFSYYINNGTKMQTILIASPQ